MEGARWSRTNKIIEESLPKVLYDSMPVIWLRPGKKSEISHGQAYECPGIAYDICIYLYMHVH